MVHLGFVSDETPIVTKPEENDFMVDADGDMTILQVLRKLAEHMVPDKRAQWYADYLNEEKEMYLQLPNGELNRIVEVRAKLRYFKLKVFNFVIFADLKTRAEAAIKRYDYMTPCCTGAYVVVVRSIS